MVSSDLPEELAIEILSWLSVTSLMRFRCVSKSWYALVETPSFISKHLNHKKNNKNNKIDDDVSFIIVKPCRDSKYSFLLLSYETLDVISEDLRFQYFRDDRRVQQEILGCCNGVICMCNVWDYDIILWNPATRQIKLVPESPIPRPKVLSSLEFGFGYDVKTNDYKAIRLVTFLHPHHDRQGEQQTEVYNLSSDSWRLIDAVVPGICVSSRHYRTCINGIYSIWGTIYGEEAFGKSVLMSFDMSDEVFLVTPLPEVIHDEDGTVDYVAFTTLKLFFETSDGELVLGDPNTRELKSLQVDGDHGSLEILAYKESLVSIKGGNHLP